MTEWNHREPQHNMFSQPTVSDGEVYVPTVAENETVERNCLNCKHSLGESDGMFIEYLCDLPARPPMDDMYHCLSWEPKEGIGLLPCPFCGGNNVDLKHYKVKNNDWWYVSCEDCEIALDPLYFNGQTKEQAIERWNRRMNE